MKNTFQVYGTYGTLTACSLTGTILLHEPEPSSTPEEGYSDIHRFDVDEWRKNYPGEALEGATNDILDMSFFYLDRETGDYKYQEVCVDWRADYRAATRTAVALPGPFTLVSNPNARIHSPAGQGKTYMVPNLPHPGHTPEWKRDDRLSRGRGLLVAGLIFYVFAGLVAFLIYLVLR